MPAVAGGTIGACPVALRRVPRAGATKHVALGRAIAQDTRERLVRWAAAVAIAPAWHDDGTGDDARPLLARPAHRGKELVRAVRFPVGNEQPCSRGDRVQHLAA